MDNDQNPSLAFERHDHRTCIESALREAEQACALSRQRLTPVRMRVLEILLEHHAAMGAYDVLARLNEEGLGNQPPVAYRALNFLVEAGLAHRIERANAFIACAKPSHAHEPAFLICSDCSRVAEIEAADLSADLSNRAGQTGFCANTIAIEITGQCGRCKEECR